MTTEAPAPIKLALSPRVESALGRINPSQRIFTRRGESFYLVAPGDTLQAVARYFNRKPMEAENLIRINRLPPGRPLRAGSWLRVPSVWVFPEKRAQKARAASTLMGCIACDKGQRGRSPRGRNGGVLSAAWWESYDSCPDTTTPVYDDEGDIIDCVCAIPGGTLQTDFFGNPIGCDPPAGGGGGGGGGGSGGGGGGYASPAERFEPNGVPYEPGVYPGYYDDADGSYNDCGPGFAYFADAYACLPYVPKKAGGDGGGKTGTGGGGGGSGGGKTGTGGGGGGSGGGGSTSTTSTTTEKSTLSKIGDFLKKPIVIGTAIAGAVVTAGVVASKRKGRRSGS